MSVWRVPHWLPSFLYFDDELLAEVFSDLTGSLPTELSNAKGGGFHAGVVSGEGTWSELAILKRTGYLDNLVEELELDPRKDSAGRSIVARVYPTLGGGEVMEDSETIVVLST